MIVLVWVIRCTYCLLKEALRDAFLFFAHQSNSGFKLKGKPLETHMICCAESMLPEDLYNYKLQCNRHARILNIYIYRYIYSYTIYI